MNFGNPFFKTPGMPTTSMQPMGGLPGTGPGCNGCAQNQINAQMQQMTRMAEQQRANYSLPGASGFNKLTE